MTTKKYLVLRQYGTSHDTAYLELADHPHVLGPCVHKTVRVHDLIDEYDGPGIGIDFDESNRAIGIEILYPGDPDDATEETDEGETKETTLTIQTANQSRANDLT